jgi:hypothetical protein
MSRHEFTFESTKTVVGWDPPLQTYFIQYGAIDEDGVWLNGEGPDLWFGTKPNEILNIDQVIHLNNEYSLGIGSSAVMERLERDRRFNV